MNPEPNWDEIGMTLMRESWTYREAEHGVTRARELFASGVSLEGAMERVRHEHNNKDMEVAQEDGTMIQVPVQWDEPNPREAGEPMPRVPRTDIAARPENPWDVSRWPLLPADWNAHFREAAERAIQRRFEYVIAGSRRLVVERNYEYFVKGKWGVRLTQDEIPRVEVCRADHRFGPDRLHLDLDEDLATCLLAALQEGGRHGDRS